MRLRYVRTPSRPRMTSAFCHVTTTFGCRNCSSASISPFLMAATTPSRRARSSACAGSSVVGACDCASSGRHRSRNRETGGHLFMVLVTRSVLKGVLGYLWKRGDPLEVLRHFAIVQSEVFRPV